MPGPAHQQADNSPGTPQALDSLISKPTQALRHFGLLSQPLWNSSPLTSRPDTLDLSQLPQGPGCSPPISRPVPTPGPPRLQSHSPAGQTPWTSASCPRVQPHSPSSAGQHPRPCSQPGQQLALPTSRLTLDPGPSALATFHRRAQLYAPVVQHQPQGPSRPCS